MALKTFISNDGQRRFDLAQELYVSTAAGHDKQKRVKSPFNRTAAVGKTGHRRV